MKHMKKIIFIFLALVYGDVNALGVLANNSKIETIANISSDNDGLYLTLVGGTGDCAGKTVFFKKENQPNESIEALNRAVSLAMLAFVSDMYVQIYNYDDDDCNGVSYIRVKKTLF